LAVGEDKTIRKLIGAARPSLERIRSHDGKSCEDQTPEQALVAKVHQFSRRSPGRRGFGETGARNCPKRTATGRHGDRDRG
jgi:hypothetical protein